MSDPPVILVMLRRPRRNDPNESRTDPLWEFGSFGCTGCHHANLMNPAKLSEIDGARLGFAQNGPAGVKLVHLTPPIRTRNHGSVGEANWDPAEMPFRYVSAPTLIDNLGRSEFPGLLRMIDRVRRETPVAKFASGFRTRRTFLPPGVGEDVIAVYERARKMGGDAAVARFYVDALPYKPRCVDHNRKATYEALLRKHGFVGDGVHRFPRSSDVDEKPCRASC